MDSSFFIQSINRRQYNDFYSHSAFSSYKDRTLTHLLCLKDDVYQSPSSLLWNPLSSDIIYASRFATCPGNEDVLALANENGQIAIQNTSPYLNKGNIFETQVHKNAIYDLAWLPNSMKLLTACGDQTAGLWDVQSNSVQPISIFRGHEKSLKTIDVHPDDNVFATGSRDGSIMIWDVRSRVTRSCETKPENVIRNAHRTLTSSNNSRKKRKQTQQTVATSITSVVFQDSNTLVSSGASAGTIHIWDLRKNYSCHKSDPVPKYTIPYLGKSHHCGIANLCLDASKSRLYAASMDGIIYEFNISTADVSPIALYGGHEQKTFFVKMCLSRDSQYLLSGSSDNHAYIWKIGNGPEPLLRLVGHDYEVTSVAWCPTDFTRIVTCSDDIRHRIWRINPGVEEDPERQLGIRGRAELYHKDQNQLTECHELLADIRSKLKAQRSTKSTRLPSSVSLNRAKAPGSIPTTPLAQLCFKTTPSSSSSSAAGSQEQVTPGSSQQRSPLKEQEENIIDQPQRNASRKLDMDTCGESYSPTRNLPNIIVDGLSPRSSSSSAGIKRKRTTNWLAELGQKMGSKGDRTSQKRSK